MNVARQLGDAPSVSALHLEALMWASFKQAIIWSLVNTMVIISQFKVQKIGNRDVDVLGVLSCRYDKCTSMKCSNYLECFVFGL